MYCMVRLEWSVMTLIIIAEYINLCKETMNSIIIDLNCGSRCFDTISADGGPTNKLIEKCFEHNSTKDNFFLCTL